MPRRTPAPAEPRWVDRVVVDAVHLDQIRVHGGLPGVRDEDALEAALARARNKWGYESGTDMAVLGAAYAFGLVTSHPFRDGNKRIAFLTMVVFLGLNGFDFDAPEADVVTMMVASAAHRASEADLTAWIRQHMKPLPR
jgi:death-on-curing protein